jgi:hypothetical protein
MTGIIGFPAIEAGILVAVAVACILLLPFGSAEDLK